MNVVDAFNLAVQHHQAGELDKAEPIYRLIVLQNPSTYEAYRNLGLLLLSQGRNDDMIVSFARAVGLRPQLADAHNNLGQGHYARGRMDQAIASFQRAAELEPNTPGYQVNLATVYQKTAQWTAAIESCRRALAIDPKFAAAHWNLGILLLLCGDLPNGWPEFEWRWQVTELDHPRVQFSQPFWDGTDLHGQRLLLHAEYGAGDAIQFIRFLPQIIDRGGHIILAAPTELLPLLANLPGIAEAVPSDQPLPPFDVHCPLLSMHRAIPITLDNLPTTPYLHADPEAAAKFTARLPNDGRRNVGLVWANKPNPADRCPLVELLAPLASAANVRFISLQKWRPDMSPTVPPLELTDWTNDLTTFADTAALIDALDLVITVDTAVAHLAGAMGKPVWLMLKFVPDWRWMVDRADSPWYPSMKLFRQPRPGDWQTPLAQIAATLQQSGPR